MKSSVVLFVIVVLFACAASPEKKYKLSDERLAKLMFDIQLAEVTLPDQSPEYRDSLKLLFDKRLEEVYQLSAAQIKEEIDLLQSDPEKLKWVIGRAKEMADSIQ